MKHDKQKQNRHSLFPSTFARENDAKANSES